MNHIALYLEKFKDQYRDFTDAKTLLQRTVAKATGVNLPLESIKEINGVVRIDCDPIERSIMYERKEKLEELLKQNLKLNRVQVR